MSMTFDEMFIGQEARTFVERRDEVVSLIRAATDLVAVERGLQPFVDRLAMASNEREFDDAFGQVVDQLAVTRAVDLASADRPIREHASSAHSHPVRARRGLRSARGANSSGQAFARN